jgi:hypothetical protein
MLGWWFGPVWVPQRLLVLGRMKWPCQQRGFEGLTTLRYTPAGKEQAIRLVRRLRAEIRIERGTISRIVAELVHGGESVRSGVRQADIDNGEKPRMNAADAEEVRALGLVALTGVTGSR